MNGLTSCAAAALLATSLACAADNAASHVRHATVAVDGFSPDTWTLDWVRLKRPGNVDMQLQLFGDYRGNVELYPQFHERFRERQWPTLIVWGRHDPFFSEQGAHAYQRDLPNAELHLLDAGHFALETHTPEIAALMRDFLERHDDALR